MREITVDSFLAHYGVKGMKWGVRRSRAARAKAAAKDMKRTEDYQKRYNLTKSEAQRRQRTAKTVRNKMAKQLATKAAVGVAVTVGAHVVARQLGQQSVRNRSVSTLNSSETVKIDLKRASDLVAKLGSNPAPSKQPFGGAIPMPPVRASARATSSKSVTNSVKLGNDKFIASLTKQHNATVKLANADLRKGYERNLVPFAAREYLKEW